ncbi:Peptidase S1 and S6 chymotrypsin/Hap OS=Tsukamurella paurometabola (strain ATCC 8368 / DSM /CCUG 35730 / CIP 100753 / JCM 10117 / KCTC 9821 / NBRC 16120/ NCIMB 702349 / NCTC 13040) OX=521096 GN=Tpau_0531 PE=4 SV=1 [Tsukamurella paurometabola]|uniref:Peptidase S1 and S6 chymotrypsin/Hap n=1 Tax=Tsukamurella paurometabola (strain ATCC 8368 / DSM 20162 / CCUG 35730 / CIP 100753 / JCM 10117 / KCTC 9821 / NBRC 16120 / NCIMB 702349 / NCTC 13040) TaxID=521096 RepID=D5USA5_TSUPD|nr:peptidase S1 and S6 chymotrypsin/Hap [Tsukamurella paurometabola DSM 20162]SUP43047.1 Serine protease 2 [Tsukamurella paurometabola]
MLASTCTVAFVAERPDGRRVALTAGHCGKRGQAVGAPVPGKPDALVRVGTFAQSSNPPARTTPEGYVLPEDLTAPDWGVIDLRPTTKSAAERGPVRPTRVGEARVGDRVCQQGVTSGWRCGVVRVVSPTQISTDITSRPGDSGGPLIRLSDGAALGIVSGGTAAEAPRDVPRMTFYWSLRDALAQGGGLRLVTAGTPAAQRVSSPEVREVITVDGTVPVGVF